MDLTLVHPRWIVTGIILILAGLWLIRWARRNDGSAEISAATAEAAFDKLRKKPGQKSAPKPGLAAVRFRSSMAQFFGIVGTLMAIAGLVSIVFGVFYSGSLP
ncbi:MAG: hypothetical protein QM780_01705 [Hyphomicrobium sp.]|uniref:hypothetical protein n=1 Tax=Hyphomicrobium sp. TaxID=82 RepID=UPI0039E72ABA